MPFVVSADRSDATETTVIVDFEDYESESIYTNNGKIVEVWIEEISGLNGTSAHPIDVYIVTWDGLLDHYCGSNSFAEEDFTALYTKENLAVSELPFHFTYTVESDDSLYLIIDNCDNQKDSDYTADQNTVKVTLAIDDESDELGEALGDAAAGLGIMLIAGIAICCVLPFSILIFVIVRKKKPEVVYQQAAPQMMTQQMAPVAQAAPVATPAAATFAPPQQPPVVASGPPVHLSGTVDSEGYEWIQHEGRDYWRQTGTAEQWTLHQ